MFVQHTEAMLEEIDQKVYIFTNPSLFFLCAEVLIELLILFVSFKRRRRLKWKMQTKKKSL